MTIPKTAFALGIWFAGWFLMRQAEAAAKSLTAPELLAIVNVVNAEQFGGWFNPLDVVALIQVESGGNPDAVRPEPRISDASIGLTQILLSTARDRGFSQGPAGLYAPEVNIFYGMRQLKWLHEHLSTRLGRAPEDYEWIGAYNKGAGAILKGNYAVAYVTKWRRARSNLDG